MAMFPPGAKIARLRLDLSGPVPIGYVTLVESFFVYRKLPSISLRTPSVRGGCDFISLQNVGNVATINLSMNGFGGGHSHHG